jgi:hypothetical protein
MAALSLPRGQRGRERQYDQGWRGAAAGDCLRCIPRWRWWSSAAMMGCAGCAIEDTRANLDEIVATLKNAGQGRAGGYHAAARLRRGLHPAVRRDVPGAGEEVPRAYAAVSAEGCVWRSGNDAAGQHTRDGEGQQVVARNVVPLVVPLLKKSANLAEDDDGLHEGAGDALGDA